MAFPGAIKGKQTEANFLEENVTFRQKRNDVSRRRPSVILNQNKKRNGLDKGNNGKKQRD